MTSTEQIYAVTHSASGTGLESEEAAPRNSRSRRTDPRLNGRNVAGAERAVSLAGGSILALLGLRRRDPLGLLIAGIGGALIYRGASGWCHVYQAVGVKTAEDYELDEELNGFEVHESLLIDKSPEELYARWRDLENLPRIMSHLKSVERIENGQSHWIADAPALAGGQVEWDAQIIADVPNERIAWQSLPDSDVDTRGSVEFRRALGDRGTIVRVSLEYRPPGGVLGKWVAKLFGEAPEQQIRDDLRNFKRVMEIGEVLTIEGQPRGSCMGLGNLFSN
jgi:uncharacterized membrane protein